MGKTRKHFLIVQIIVAKWYRQNHRGFTVNELHSFMDDQGKNPVQKRTVRRSLNDLADVNFLQKTKIGNSTLYVPDIALFPSPKHSYLNSEQEEKIEFEFKVE